MTSIYHQPIHEDSWDQLIADLRVTADTLVGPDGAVTDKGDQVRILEDFKRANFDIGQFSCLGALFCHADRIRYVCADLGYQLPDWFIEKYGRHFHS